MQGELVFWILQKISLILPWENGFSMIVTKILLKSRQQQQNKCYIQFRNIRTCAVGDKKTTRSYNQVHDFLIKLSWAGVNKEKIYLIQYSQLWIAHFLQWMHFNFNVRGYQIKQNSSENSGQENTNNYNKF